MNYGFDLSGCRFTTDHEGNRESVELPIRVFNLLMEFRNAALRAQTAEVEKHTPRGTYRSSLASLASLPGPASIGDEPSPIKPPAPQTKRERAERLFLTPEERIMQEALRAVEFPSSPGATPTGPSAPPQEPDSLKRPRRPKQQVFFPRVFSEPVPEEVARLIEQGTYMLRAWRLYRELSPGEAAELAGLSRDTILWHEHGYNVPNIDTLKRCADIYDCTVAQLTPKPGSETTPVQSIRTRKARAMEYAPDDTRYPDAVMAYLIQGKSPVVAWRLYRHMTIDQCAKAFGCTPKAFKDMEALPVLRDRTRKSLAMVLSCNPMQLLCPKSLVVETVSSQAEPTPSAHGRQGKTDNLNARSARL
ncbi:hypothetical protein BTH42_32075 [Burkholderia sp. SRS-W-2-2016]|uniref:helix-turn-helix domain-containing protein n=1 Tax=Burkholderia sp. SRS-W-2-2016 TaxID=1926878 RepID=UPI00094B3B73|nr:helix-turn-helix domain-containing protein [Burkholderia sp. SRS-W-2-2016]OLL27483.1 hypothetical protein BTH42_32075 [Burkholderia sp. SRS-W-2-2016]